MQESLFEVTNQKALIDFVCSEYKCEEVTPFTAYKVIFHIGQGILAKQCEKGENNKKPNLVALWQKTLANGKQRWYKRVLYEDTIWEDLKWIQDKSFAIMSGCSYFGRRNSEKRASKLHALIFDIDDIDEETVNNLLYPASLNSHYPMPTFIAFSGHGMHLYYVFKNPIDLYPNVKRALKEYKAQLTGKLWNRYTSHIVKPQQQGYTQGFRILGSPTKVKGHRVRIVRSGPLYDGLEDFDKYLWYQDVDKIKAMLAKRQEKLEVAKQKYPDWYERRIVNKQPKGTWICKPDLYYWWKNKMLGSASYGHRYFCVMVLAIYAKKSGISYEQLKKEAFELIPEMTKIRPSEPFTEDDVEVALKAYNDDFFTFPIHTIKKLTAISFERNRRNNQKQKVHLKIARSIQEIKAEEHGIDWRYHGGAPNKQQVVLKWRENNPNGKKIECERDTGLSRPTVLKWWG